MVEKEYHKFQSKSCGGGRSRSWGGGVGAAWGQGAKPLLAGCRGRHPPSVGHKSGANMRSTQPIIRLKIGRFWQSAREISIQ